MEVAMCSSSTCSLKAPAVLVFCIAQLLLSAQVLAEPPTFEIGSVYSEYLVGEVVMVRVRIVNPPGNDILSVVKLSGAAMYPGSFDTELVEPTGVVIPTGHGVGGRNWPSVLDIDLIKIAPGTRWEGEATAWQSPRVTGQQKVRVTYRPKWKAPPEIYREFSINVIAAEPSIVESKTSPPGVEGKKIEILKVRTADGYWLFYRDSPNGSIRRLVQINEKATFSVSERQEYKGYPGGVCV
jgi:hypothetical protein